MKAMLLVCLIAALSMNSQENHTTNLDVLLKKFEQPNGPGMGVGIVQNGNLAYSKYSGLANMEYAIKNCDSTAFNLASISKQFTAACAFALISDHKLSLDDDIRKFLPEMPKYEIPIKVRHLMNHTSGLRNYHTLMNLYGFDYETEYYDNQTILNLMSRQKSLNNIPGEKVIYGNSPYNLLAIIIERISGKNLHDFAVEKLFQPLGMLKTSIQIENNSLIKNRAIGYVANGDKSFSQYSRIQRSYGAGSMVSTIPDMVKWANMLNGSIEEFAELAAFLITPEKLPSGTFANYARGVMIDQYKGYLTIHHSGTGMGIKTKLISVPELQISVIVLANSDINTDAISYEIVDFYLPERKFRRTSKPFREKKNDYVKYVGQYQELNSDMKMEILLQNDTLKSKGVQSKKGIPLICYEKNKFHRQTNQSVKYHFPNDNKSYDMIISFGGTPFYFKRALFVDPKGVNPSEYVGTYFSDELQVQYSIFVKNDALYLSYKNHESILLSPGQTDEFGSGDRVLYHFSRNSRKEIDRLFVSSDGSVKDITFVKK